MKHLLLRQHWRTGLLLRWPIPFFRRCRPCPRRPGADSTIQIETEKNICAKKVIPACTSFGEKYRRCRSISSPCSQDLHIFAISGCSNSPTAASAVAACGGGCCFLQTATIRPSSVLLRPRLLPPLRNGGSVRPGLLPPLPPPPVPPSVIAQQVLARERR